MNNIYELNKIDLNHIDLQSINLNSLCLNAIGVRSGGSKKEYIKGHVTDGSSTFQFTIGSTTISVPVKEDGWFEWNDFDTYSSSFNGNALTINPEVGLLDIVSIYIKNRTLYRIAISRGDGGSVNTSLKIIDFNHSTIKMTYRAPSFYRLQQLEEIRNTENITVDSNDYRAIRALFYANLKLKNLPYMCNWKFFPTGGDYDLSITGLKNTLEVIDGLIPITNSILGTQFGIFINLEEIKACAEILYSISFASSSKLTEQSIVNLFNAVAKDGITLTFHPTVGAMIDAQMDAEEGAIFDAYMNSDYEFEYTY